jgi:ABC-type transport system involved in multi-copper enzyme maturation permease subunit
MMTICRTTYTRVLRTRSLYFLLGVVLVLVAIAHLYTDLTGGREKELMYDTGAALLSLVGLLTALMVTFDIARDLREKVAIVLFSKPLGRTHYLVGKLFGVVWLATINLAILTFGIFLILRAEKDAWQWDFFRVALSTWGSTVMLTAVGVFFASFLAELPAALATVITYVVGNSTEVLYKPDFPPATLLFSILPNFGLLDFKTEFGNDLAISWTLIIASVVYALIYSVALLSLSSILFHKRDLA